jgi:SAM-dependent methyltransferase
LFITHSILSTPIPPLYFLSEKNTGRTTLLNPQYSILELFRTKVRPTFYDHGGILLRILDATAGTRSIWYQKHLPFVTFMDKRSKDMEIHCRGNGGRRKKHVTVKPDIIADWTEPLPFEPASFDLVVFDPPHLLRERGGGIGIMPSMYGYLDRATWKTDLRVGIRNLFCVLKDDGFFILKWSELDIPLGDVLKLFPYRPLFGTRTGQRNNTHWVLFIKHNIDQDLRHFEEGSRSS